LSPLTGLGKTYDVHLGLIGKPVVDFLLVLIEHFSLDVMAEVIWAKIDKKLAISIKRCQFDPKFQVEGDVPTVDCVAAILRSRGQRSSFVKPSHKLLQK